jgi:hypothetical protein
MRSIAAWLLARRLSNGLALTVIACLTSAQLQAQDWMAGASPWSTFPDPMAQSTLSQLSNIASPMGQSPSSAWSGYSTPMSLSPWSSLPSQYHGQFGSYLPSRSDNATSYLHQPQSTGRNRYGSQVQTCPTKQDAYSFQPDLTGLWRGRGGESIEVKRNYARIWGGEGKPCNCVFFPVGQRLIAYSPDTDIVRKYWFKSGGNNPSTLIEESVNVMSYQRTC